MSLFWGRHGDCWEPEGGERREWRDLLPGDLLQNGRQVWRVHEVRPVPVADWEDPDREAYDSWNRRSGAAGEEWPARPLYLVVSPGRGGKKRHVRARPYNGLRRSAYVLHPHYPVCTECGEPWPCPEIGITREVRKQTAEVERLASILPGCCWSCGEPVTGRHSSIVFEGENLLLPGAPAPVFHLRVKEGCRGAAISYEDRWVTAGEGRTWRLQCSGKLTEHVDGPACDRDACPGPRSRHAERATHVLTQGGTVLRWAKDCARCADAAERRACRWLPDDEVRALLSWNGPR